MSDRQQMSSQSPSWVSNLTQIEDHLHPLEQDAFWEALWRVCALAGQTDPTKPQLTNTTVVGFPGEQIDFIYQSADSDHLGPRTQVLVERVSDCFSPRVNGGIQHDHTEITGVLRLLAAVYDQRKDSLSALDRARLLGVMGMLCRNYTGPGNAQLGLFWQNKGIEYLKRAAELGDNLPAGLQRHLNWLTADTLIGKVGTHGHVLGYRDEQKIVHYLVRACQGDPLEATEGLYFSCISRLFTLCDEARIDFASQMLGDLRRAWCVLSAASIKKDREAQEAEEMVAAEAPAGNLDVAVLSPKEKFVRLPIEQLWPMLPDLLEWHAEDRFAVCTLLSWYAQRRGWHYEAHVYGYEAAKLLNKLDKSRLYRPAEPSVIIHHVRQLLSVAERMKEIHRPEIPLETSVRHSLPQDAVPFIQEGDVEGAIRVLEDVGRQTRFSVQRDMYRLRISELLGDADNARQEKKGVLRVLEDLEREEHTPRYAAMVRAEAFRLLARNSAYCNAPQDLDGWLARNHEAVGESASPLLACFANRSLYGLRMDSDVRLADRPIQGQFIWLSILWDSTTWIDGRYQCNVDKFRRPIPDEARSAGVGPRAFSAEVGYLAAHQASPAEVLALVEQGCAMDPGRLLVPWAIGLTNLFGRVRNLYRKYGPMRSKAYGHLNKKAEFLSWLVDRGLKFARATEVRERLAMVLCAWLESMKTYGKGIAPNMFATGEQLVCKSMRTAFSLTTTRIALAASCSRSRQNAFRRRLRTLLLSLAETGCLDWFRRDLNGYVDQCKTNDAEVAQFNPPSESEVEDFENFALIAPGQAELDRPATLAGSRGADDAPAILNCFAPGGDPDVARSEDEDGIQGRALLNYFLPGYSGGRGEQAAFVVLKRRRAGRADSPDEIIPLSDLHEALRSYRNCLFNAWKCHRSSLGLPSTKEDKLTNIPRLLSDLEGVLDPAARDPFSGNNGLKLNQCIDALQQSLVRLGQALLPPPLRARLAKLRQLVVVPDGRLFMIPIHAIPYDASGRTLLDDKINVSYRPRSDYGKAWRSAPARKGLYACVNTEDPDFAGAEGIEALTRALGAGNSWSELCSPDETLRQVANAGVSIIMVHGHSVRKHELASRIALKAGRCLTTLDILQSRQDFKGSSVFLFACNSTPQRTAIGRDLLGPAGAFLTSGVGCVSASIWKCRINDALVIARHLHLDQPRVKDASKVWSKGLQELSATIHCPLERFVRLGCFMLYSSR